MGVILWACLVTFMLLRWSASHGWASGLDIHALLWLQNSTKNMDQVFTLRNSHWSIGFSWAAEWTWFLIWSACKVLSELSNWAFRPCAFKSYCMCVSIGTYIHVCETCCVGTYLCPTSVRSHTKEHSMEVVYLNFLYKSNSIQRRLA